MEPQTRFCTSTDGTRIAYAALGAGPPLVSVIGWGFALESSESLSEDSAWAGRMGKGRLSVRFDRRGIGASQRDVEDVSLEAQVADLAAVVDHVGLDQFDLWGAYDGAAVAVAYAAQCPKRLSHLVLWAPFPQGTDIASPRQSQSIIELVRQNWSLARRAIADIIYPSGPTELQRALAGVMRESISPELAAKYLEVQANADITDLLPRVKTPTLVLHRRGDRNVPSRAGLEVAALIPDARLVVLEGDVSVPTHGDTSYLDSVIEFLDEGREAPSSPPQASTSGDVHTILFTDMESSTALRRKLGDAKVQELVRTHNTIVRDALQASGGNEIKHTGDGIMASFTTATSALECSIAIQRGVAAHVEEQPDTPLGVYIGLNAGEPIAEEHPDGQADLFGTSVDLARRICDHAEPGQILASNVVRELSEGKGFLFSDIGDVVPKGFEQPVRLYEVRWREDG